MLFDLKRCIGCHTCTFACKMENGIQRGSWIRIETIGGTDMDTPEGKYPNVHMHFLPKLCNHCAQPACLPACPTHAIYKRKDGIVLIDREKCTGCKICTKACPYGIPTFNPKTGVVEMCTLCSGRIDKGLEPFCVRCCVTKAIEFGEIDDADSKISRLMHKKRAFTLLPESGTQPSVHYSST
jgi:Fe-S-cluster-containing dehydrogenase component